MKKRTVGVIASLAIMVGVGVVGLQPQEVKAARFSTAQSTYIRENEKIDGSAYVAGENVTVDGTITGDLYCAASNVIISGSVGGDIICAGAKIVVIGKTGGDLRVAGQDVQLRGAVGGTVTVFAESFETEQATRIEGDLNGAVSRARLAGSYGRDIALTAERMTIVGTVARDVEGKYQSLKLADGAAIGGRLSYVSPQDAELQGTVAGDVRREPGQARNSAGISMLIGAVTVILGMLLLGFALAYLMPKRLDEMAAFAGRSPARPLLWGAVACMIVPLAILFMLFSYVGVVIGIFALVLWLLVVLLSGPIVSYLVGKKVLPNSQSVPARSLLGGAILIALYLIPVVNIFVAMAVLIYGSGTLLGYGYSKGLFDRYRPAKTGKKNIS